VVGRACVASEGKTLRKLNKSMGNCAWGCTQAGLASVRCFACFF